MATCTFRGAGLGGLALLLLGCGSDPAPPAPASPDEQQALAEAEEMIAAGRPGEASPEKTDLGD